MASHFIDPREEATFNVLIPGMPEMSGIKDKLSQCVNGMSPSQVAETDPRGPAAVAIPLYIYPAPGCWKPLLQALAENPSVQFHLVVNPANGPGGAVPDSNYIDQVARLNSFPNATLFGYVHVSWAKRDLQQVLEDISTWADWSKYSGADIHVDGIFVDEAPSDTVAVPYMTKVYQHVKKVFKDDAAPVWTNPGVRVDDAFYAWADLVNSHENTHAGWVKQKTGSTHPKSTIMIHSYSGSASQLRSDTASLLRSGYRSVLITTANCYTSFSTSLQDFIGEIAEQNGDVR